jgi:hypothetical protein
VTIEEKIREAAATKIRVTITGVRRSKHGFLIMASDGSVKTLPTRKIALQALYAVVRCAPVRIFTVKAVRPKTAKERTS